MLNSVSIETPGSLATPDCPADNHARQLAQFLYGTLATIKKYSTNEISTTDFNSNVF